MTKLYDNELGDIFVEPKRRMKHVVARKRSDGIYLSVPSGITTKEVELVIDQMRHKLRELKARPEVSFDVKGGIHSPFVDITVVEAGTYNSAKVKRHDALFEVILPNGWLFESEKHSAWLRTIIQNILRVRAHEVLIPLAHELAQKHGYEINTVKISSSRGRWGSCSRTRNINLSLYLMLMPRLFVEYVVLHELVHTRHFDHSVAFWAELSGVWLQCQNISPSGGATR